MNQWLLKVLLGQRMSPGYITVPKGEIPSPSQLAKAASVSLPSVSRFVRHLSDEGFIERGPRRLELVRVSELLAKWKAATSLSPRRQTPMAWALRSGSSLDQLKSALLNSDISGRAPRGVCLALFSACELLDVGIVRGAAVHLYVRSFEPSWFEELGLMPAGHGTPVDVFVRVPRWRESVFRGTVMRDGVPVADALQCWLDVSNEASRGDEQAEFLWRRVLRPALQLEGPQP